MAVVVLTSQAAALLSALDKAIEAGLVQTWQRTPEGDYTLGSPGSRFYGRAFLRPKRTESRLTFRVLRPSGQSVSQEVFGAYQARFIELLLTHFSDQFHEVRASSTPTTEDKV